MPIYKRCSRCGKRILAGTVCKCIDIARHKEYDQSRRDAKSKAFYNSGIWIRTKDRVLSMDGMDVYEFMTTGRIMAPDTVHHVIPLRDDWNKRLDAGNLMSLSAETHGRIEREYAKDKAGMIRKLQKMLKDFRELQGDGGI